MDHDAGMYEGLATEELEAAGTYEHDSPMALYFMGRAQVYATLAVAAATIQAGGAVASGQPFSR